MDERVRIGSESHYEDADYYDQTYRRRKSDVRFYGDAAEAYGRGGTLELGCGTGRVTLEMATRSNASIVGVDRMATMLTQAKERLAPYPHVKLKSGDLRSVRVKDSSKALQKFSLVVSPFNVWNHLYERSDVERAFKTVRAHLAPRGRFVFDIRMPHAGELARSPERIYLGRPVTWPSTGKRYRYRERFDYDPLTQIQFVDMAFVGETDPTDFRLTPLTQRHFYPQEMEALLHYAGFAISDCFGAFDASPLEAHSESQIYVCTLRKGFIEP